MPAANELNIRFNEPMGDLADLYDAATNQLGARYEVIDPITSQTSYPIAATVVDRGLGVLLTYSSAVDASAQVNVIGLRDLAGNPLFPALGGAIVPYDGTAPAIGGTPPSFEAVQGVNNDEITIVFDTAIATWNATNPANYTLVDVTPDPDQPVDLTAADIRFDGDRTVTILLGAGTGAFRDASSTYEVRVEVLAEDPIRTVQGEAITATSVAAGITVGGDNATGPSQAGTVAFTDPGDVNALFVVFDETVDQASAETAANLRLQQLHEPHHGDARRAARGAARLPERGLRGFPAGRDQRRGRRYGQERGGGNALPRRDRGHDRALHRQLLGLHPGGRGR